MLRLSAGYAFAWAAWLFFFLDGPAWRYGGLLSAAAGAGLALASADPIRHWRLVLVALLAKLAAPLALGGTGKHGETAAVALVSIELANCVPLAVVALRGWREERAVADVVRSAAVRPLESLLERFHTKPGESLAELSARTPALFVFLRQAGCTFCRQTLHDLAVAQERIAACGLRIVVVHHSSDGAVEALCGKYGLDQAEVVADHSRKLYRAMGLGRGSLMQLYSPVVWLKGLWYGAVKGHGIGREDGDAAQMPGAFVIHKGQVFSSYYCRSAADRPDFVALCSTARNRIEDQALMRGLV